MFWLWVQVDNYWISPLVPTFFVRLYSIMVCYAYFQMSGAVIKEVVTFILPFFYWLFRVDNIIVIVLIVILLISWILYSNKPIVFFFFFFGNYCEWCVFRRNFYYCVRTLSTDMGVSHHEGRLFIVLEFILRSFNIPCPWVFCLSLLGVTFQHDVHIYISIPIICLLCTYIL